MTQPGPEIAPIDAVRDALRACLPILESHMAQNRAPASNSGADRLAYDQAVAALDLLGRLGFDRPDKVEPMTAEGFKAWREAEQLTQPQVAQRIGMTKRTIYSYETEGDIPLRVRLACAAVALGIWDYGGPVNG